MFDIMKKRKSKRTVQPNSMMLFKKEKPKSSLLSCFRMHKKNKKYINYEMSDDKLRSKTIEDCVKLNGIERSNPGERFNVIRDYDSLQATPNPGSMRVTVVSLKKKQKEKKSFADNGGVKELDDCERTTMFSSQDNLQKCVQVIIDCDACKVTVYSHATNGIEDGARIVEKNNEKYGTMRRCSNFEPKACEVEKKRKDVHKSFQLNICRPETGEDVVEICNQKQTATILPTRHQTNTVAVVSPLLVERNTVHVEESTVVNIDDNTAVKTGEHCHFCTANGSSNMEPDPESQSEDTFVKDANFSSRSFEDNDTNVSSLQERDNTSSEELNWSSFDSFSTGGQETVQETEEFRTCSGNDNYSEDQKSRNENKKETVAGTQMVCQTDAQYQDIQHSHLVHSDSIQESGHSPHSMQVSTHKEGKNALCQHQMFTKLDHDMKCSSMYDLPDSCITNMTVAKLVQKVDHLESVIGRLSRFIFFAVKSNSIIPGSLKKQDLVISECQENCKVYLNDDDIISLIKRNLFQETSQLANSFIHPECQEQTGLGSLCLSYNTLDLESLQYNRVRQMSPATSIYILAEKMNGTWSANTGQREAMKTKMQKVPKALKRGEPVKRPIGTVMLERSMWDKGAESDEIGHTLSLQIDPHGGNVQHNLNVKRSLKGQAETIPLVVELSKFKSSKWERDRSFTEEISVEMDDTVTHRPDSLQLKDVEEKDLIHNEAKSRCLSEAILIRPIILGHTNRTPMENIDNDAQLEMAANSTAPECARAVGSSGYSENDYTDTRAMPIMDSKPTFINSDPHVSCGRESVKDQVWNKLNLERNETAVSISKLDLEAADSCSDADSTDHSCLNPKENVMVLSSNALKVKETDCCPNADAIDASCLHQMDSNIGPVKTNPFKFSPEMDPVISDREHIPGHCIPLRVQDTSKEEFTGESQSVWDCDPEKPIANYFVSGSNVQERKLKETTSVLNKKKTLRSKSVVRCRLCSLQRRKRGKKRKVKLKKSMELGRKVSHTENLPGILSDLKILLHYLTSSFAQDTAPSGALTQATIMRKEKADFATEVGIIVSEKAKSSQERLIDDFLKSLVSTWFIFPTIRNGLQTVILLPTGLQLYFERLLRGAPPEERERMSYEWLRLQTFINYPSSAQGSGIRLARAGFYYSGNGTVTVCYACGGQHSGWNFHDDPYEIHQRISPDCPFLKGNPPYPNVPIMQEGEQIGIQMGSNASNTPLSQTINLTMVNSPSNSNRTSEISPPTVFQSQNSTITQAGAESSAVTSPSMYNSQEGGSEQQASQQTMSKFEHFLGIVPSSINPASSTHVDEIPSVIDQPVTLTAAVVPNTSGEFQQEQSPTTAATTLIRPQQPTDDAENTQYRSPGNFVLIKPAGQVEDPGVDPTPQTMSERPRHPEYAPLSSRINSYTGWPARLDQTPQQMAEAGFFYAGSMDYTRCFQCGGGLRNWEPGDNPWIEHARWYPQCAYVLGKRGQKFVNAVLKKQAELLAAQGAQRNNSNTTTTTTITTTSSVATSKTGTQSAQELASQSGQPRYFQSSNENEIANRLINEMGYQQERVREAILEVKRRRGQQEIAIEHVIELLTADEERSTRAGRQNEAATVEELIQESGRLTLHDDSNPPPAIAPPAAKTTATTTQASQSSGPLNQVAGGRSSGQNSRQTIQTSAPGRGPLVRPSRLNMPGPMSIAVDVSASSSASGNQEGDQSSRSTSSNRPSSPLQLEPTSLPAFDAESLREEYLRLRDQNLCKICMERNVELAFLPCGHLVCCEVCGQTLRFCPICRAKIHASVKTYLS